MLCLGCAEVCSSLFERMGLRVICPCPQLRSKNPVWHPICLITLYSGYDTSADNKMIVDNEKRPLLVLIVAAALVVFLRSAWVSDDAFITFRTVENFVGGDGLTWNPDERVQAYTHPLWMFLLSAGRAVSGEIYYTTLALSICLSIISILLLLRSARTNAIGAIVAAGLLLVSKSFVDYSTSGLENPLTYCILGVGFLTTFDPEKNRRKNSTTTAFRISFVVALLMLNRMDLSLVMAPLAIYSCFRYRRWKGLAIFSAGLLPFFVWETFSLFYYGFPFPNTAYAKLGAGIDRFDLVGQGLFYVLDSMGRDPVTLIITTLGVGIASTKKDWNQRCLAIGIGLYLIYVIAIGGDFMSGRFFSAPFYASMFLIFNCRVDRLVSIRFGLLALIVVGVFNPNSPLRTQPSYTNRSLNYLISDERGFYYQKTGLLNGKPFYKGFAEFKYVMVAEHILSNEIERPNKEEKYVVIRGSVGMYGYSLKDNPRIHVIDRYGLADPLLARLPGKFVPVWRIGHYGRDIPSGYQETLQSGENRIKDKKLAEYYRHLKIIVSDDLWSLTRLETIFKMNTRQYRELINTYRYQYPGQLRIEYNSISSPVSPGTAIKKENCHILSDSGARIAFKELQHAEEMVLGVDHRSDYRIIFRNKKRIVGELISRAQRRKKGALGNRNYYIPQHVKGAGFDSIILLPLTKAHKKEKRCLAHLKLYKKK